MVNILKKQNKLCYSGCSSKHGVEGTGHSSASPWSSLFILGHILGSSVATTARTLRIADGADEVHLGTIGKLEVQRASKL
ncbi:hypothetical protein HID58_096006 [Brassica napus]|uniref:Uncharacterized protein n=1 Tax=Brassica napus TaxID=3708 RepID=A0ABQ7X1V8_BRANA|nr:hypothetical protein HID58_096006 [Brassica napus]